MSAAWNDPFSEALISCVIRIQAPKKQEGPRGNRGATCDLKHYLAFHNGPNPTVSAEIFCCGGVRYPIQIKGSDGDLLRALNLALPDADLTCVSSAAGWPGAALARFGLPI